MFYTKFLRNIEQQFDYNVRIGAKALCEAGSNTEEVEALERLVLLLLLLFINFDS